MEEKKINETVSVMQICSPKVYRRQLTSTASFNEMDFKKSFWSFAMH